MPTGSTAGPNHLLALIPVVRIVDQLKRTLKTRTLATATIQIYDEHFNSIMNSYPDPFPLSSTTPLDACLIYPVTALQICKLMLYRHNLSPVCRLQDRQDALARCTQVAKDTAHYIWRTTPMARTQHPRSAVHPPDMSNPEWQIRMRHAGPSFLVKHWWRCVLILCYHSEFAYALTIIGGLKAVGPYKTINFACGRHLTFFLDVMIQKWQSGKVDEQEIDEELLAYASGDLQSNPYASWIWQGSEVSGASRNKQGESSQQPTNSPIEQVISHPALLNEEEQHEWGSWERIEEMVHQLRYLRTANVSGNKFMPPSLQENRFSKSSQDYNKSHVLQQQHYSNQQQQHNNPNQQRQTSTPSPSLISRHGHNQSNPGNKIQQNNSNLAVVQPSPFRYPSPSTIVQQQQQQQQLQPHLRSLSSSTPPINRMHSPYQSFGTGSASHSPMMGSPSQNSDYAPPPPPPSSSLSSIPLQSQPYQIPSNNATITKTATPGGTTTTTTTTSLTRISINELL